MRRLTVQVRVRPSYILSITKPGVMASFSYSEAGAIEVAWYRIAAFDMLHSFRKLLDD